MARIHATVKSEPGATYLGACCQNRCDGDQANGQCVKFTGDSAKSTTVFDSLPWVNKVNDAIKTIRQSEEATRQAKIIKAQLETELLAIRASVNSIRHRRKVKDSRQVADSAIGPERYSKTCEAHHARKDNCTKANCNYDATTADGKKCKPKPGSETTTKKTAEKEAETKT
ncbi:variant surface glycoprotein (VSG), putative [Trypanosoma equiperdum]|uniref:Variant surface glycoprotein (VSG), putative n=1 Tax=Trypanosoma equiperdum TaxID=5694 RepID=A0A1G4IB41_TRYEQ|nr:variant surface glycoprotein (VSG), putative [Trypanosoma equiperdum]